MGRLPRRNLGAGFYHISNNGKVITVQQINSAGTNGNLITYNYDEFNRQIGTIETFGTATVNTSAATYDNNGNILTQTVNGQTTSFEYDIMGRQTKVTAPGGVVTNTTYYPTGEVRRVDGATYPVEYTYNGLGKQATMTTFKDANTPQVTFWTYNARGEMVQKTYADGNSVNYTYNADGQLLTRTWARGIVTTYTYDNAGRTTGYSYSDGVTPAVVITLDFLDRQSSITDAAGTRNFSYNANNQLGNETNPSIMNGMIAYTYDNAGRRTGMNLSNGTDSFAQANYTYDTRGRIATVGNNTDTLTYTYIPGTNMIGSAAWLNASINTVNTYDQYKRLTNIAVNGANVYGYTLNDKNQRTSATLPDGNKWNYTYDVMGQLTGAVKQNIANNPLANMNYFYDLIGNRTSATENSATTTYASNLVNQYTAVNTVVPVYDLDGNMTNYNGWTYTYNGENRLIVAENAASGVRVEADYDYMGRRLFKKVYNNNILVKHYVFIYNSSQLIAEFDLLNDSCVANYLWQPIGLHVVLLRNSEYLIADGNKNIIQVRNATGSVTDSYIYDPFGKVTHNGGSENPFQFSSEFFDSETGLVYYNYRYYMPNLGRWINRDPIEEDTASLILFVNNSAISYTDKNGLCGWRQAFGGYADAAAHAMALDDLKRKARTCPKNAKIRDIGSGLFKYRTKEQNGIPTSNGCGPSGFWSLVPEFVFTPACDNHDRCWGTCNSSMSQCNKNFLHDMQRICNKSFEKYSKVHYDCLRLAFIYYIGVQGKKFYESAQDEMCKWETCCMR